MKKLSASKSNTEPDSSSNMDTSAEIPATLSDHDPSHPADTPHDQESELRVSVEVASVENNRVGSAERAIEHSPEQQEPARATEHNHVPASEPSELETDPLQSQRPWTGLDFETSLHFAERVTSCPRTSSTRYHPAQANPLSPKPVPTSRLTVHPALSEE
ncbi:uncharacterized protein BO72DRAFT_139237 [Aspergillus fijiensis CBS 313.89]|uniref:Uncharacterized protein n=1 Tax=Aspergillus fijiensis CBS 313.89 TaxID=1448319 RepID=A0A8G1W2J9_9EURO|nr:uncharacterized protein BO72DRAFT_139237 [Aspergillus fijiensis CBS 313.89]RAK82110.1 hypothetical protein BO72DRAFT_139237 [Aspergillus fijiensis CBS 313.89]